MRVFCEKFPFDSLFSSESCIFPMGFLFLLKMYNERFYILEKMGFGMTSRQCGIHSKPQPLLQKTCLFNTSETLAMYGGVCLCTNALAHVCKLLPTYVGRWPLVCCRRQLKIKPILLKRYVVVQVRIVPTESI